jgi:hypothetical protein
MSTRDDTLDLENPPDRVFYELGVMLDKEDFRGEQTYHRGRLARALAFLEGPGTVAGLRVDVTPDPATPAPPSPDAEEVRVHPGLAIDEVGRLIEVPSLRCTRVARWYAAQAADQDGAARLRAAFHPVSVGAAAGHVIVDLFLRFAACERGKTPAFATGPFDALDAVQPSRIRDGFELQLVPRIEGSPPLPPPRWPVFAGTTAAERRQALHSAILDAWDAFRPKNRREEDVPDDPVVPTWFDPYGARHWILLARLSIPATDQGVDLPAQRDASQKIVVDSTIRPFVYTPGALLRLLSQE